jgi:hypothetical protein
MTDDADVPVLERPAFYDGQQLTAGDLADAQRFHRELRWLHTRALHAWGVVVGYAVAGARGASEVTVGPGFAIDCRGRELILAAPVTLAVPAVSAARTYYLTASYAEDDALPPRTRAGACGAAGAVRRPERAQVRWQARDDAAADGGIRPGEDVILATVAIRNCQLAKAISARDGRDEMPAPDPYIAAGRTEAGRTPWQLLLGSDGAPVGVFTVVPTASAGFRDTPQYQANVVGERITHGGWTSTLVVDGWVSIHAATAASFEAHVILPPGTAGDDAPLNEAATVLTEGFLDVLATELQWHVVWLGVEG